MTERNQHLGWWTSDRWLSRRLFSLTSSFLIIFFQSLSSAPCGSVWSLRHRWHHSSPWELLLWTGGFLFGRPAFSVNHCHLQLKPSRGREEMKAVCFLSWLQTKRSQWVCWCTVFRAPGLLGFTDSFNYDTQRCCGDGAAFNMFFTPGRGNLPGSGSLPAEVRSYQVAHTLLRATHPYCVYYQL